MGEGRERCSLALPLNPPTIMPPRKVSSSLVRDEGGGYHGDMGRIRTWQESQEEEILAAVQQHLAAQEVVALPTETFYALAADPFSPEALGRVFALKQRAPHKAVLILVASPDMLLEVAREVPEVAQILMARFWPGPLTLILPGRDGLPGLLTGGTGTIGVRWPRQEVTCRIIARLGYPVTGTSANRTGAPPLTGAAEIARDFPEVPLIVDAGPCPGGLPSTIIDLTRRPPRLVRAGAVPVEVLLDLIPHLAH